MIRRPPRSTLFPYHDALPISTRLEAAVLDNLDRLLQEIRETRELGELLAKAAAGGTDRKSTRLNSSHLVISYAVFCLKKKKKIMYNDRPRQSQTILTVHVESA